MSTGVKKEAPLCECGCGKPVRWLEDKKRWNKRILNHNTGRKIAKRIITNTDIETYVFEDMDLERAINSLDERGRQIAILRLMGFNQPETAKVTGVTRSAVCKRWKEQGEFFRQQLVV